LQLYIYGCEHPRTVCLVANMHQRTHRKAYLPIHRTRITIKTNWFWYAKWYK